MILNKALSRNETIFIIFVIRYNDTLNLEYMNNSLVIFFFLIIGNICFSQENSESDRVQINVDNRIDQFIEIEKRIDQMQGFRLQICFDSNKEVVDAARDKFLREYPLTDTYITYENPHFNLKVGDFRTKLEAEKIKRELFGKFVICIVHEELINLPRID